MESLLGSAAPVQSDPWAVPVSHPAAQTIPADDPWAAFETPAPINVATPTASFTPPVTIPNRANAKTPENFLGENSSLVNLDNLMGPASQPKAGK